MFDAIKNVLLNHNRYKTASNAVIVSCFFNPENSPYRVLAFQKFYRSIKHLNHRIIECLIGETQPQLPDSEFITRVSTKSLLWHKEALLNKVIADLPPEFEYVFWVDADVLFANSHWLTDAVKVLEDGAMVVQPFEYCVHLGRNEMQPSFDVAEAAKTVSQPLNRHPLLWRSFASNHENGLSAESNYDKHGHVGFAWGARRSVLNQVPLYDKALIGGADHIMAHAAAGQIVHPCIAKSFTDDLADVKAWSKRFYSVVDGKIGYAPGVLLHLWHGEIEKRQYLKRIQDFTKQAKQINERDENGLYVQTGQNAYMDNYYRQREVYGATDFGDYDDDDFATDMGYTVAAFVATHPQQPFTQQQSPDWNAISNSPQPDPYSTPVEATYPVAPDVASTPVEADYNYPNVDTTPVEASYDSPTLSHMDNPVDSTPVEADSGNFS